MDRREFVEIAAMWSLAGLFPARAQQSRVARIGILLFNSPQIDYVVPLVDGLKALGYVEGQTAHLEYRYANGNAGLLPELAAELAALQPDIIFAYGGDVAPHAKRQPVRFRSLSW